MKKKILRYITQSSLYAKTRDFVQRVTFKRYDGISLYDIIKVFAQKITKDDIFERANGVAFNFTLAIFPGIIFLFNLTPFISNYIPEVSQENIMSFVGNFMAPDMYSTVYLTVEDIVHNQRGGLLTFGALFALFLATNGMVSLMKAFNSVYKTVEKRTYLKMRLVATLLTLMLAFVLMLSTVLLVVGNVVIALIQSINWLHLEDQAVFLIFISRFVILFTAFFLAISFIYYFGPAIHYNWRFFSLGAVLATLLALAASYGFSFYLVNFSTYNKLYGSLGVMIALMIYLEILSIILLLGYEFNASIHHAHRISGIQDA